MVAEIDVAVPPDIIVTPAVDPFQRICGFVREKLVPVAVNVKGPEPAVADVGLMEVSVGVEPVLTLAHEVTKIFASIEPKPVA